MIRENYIYSSKENDDPILDYQSIDTSHLEKKPQMLLGLPFYNATTDEMVAHSVRSLEKLRESKSQSFHPMHIMPIDPYIFFYLRWNKKFRKVAQESFINLPAALGLRFIGKLFKVNIAEITPTVNYTMNIIRLAQAKELSIFIIGSSPDILEKLHVNFLRSFPKLRITGKHHGQLSGESKKNVIEALRKTDPHVIIISMGFAKEMRWIKEYKKELKNCLLINLNGSLDFMAGKKKRAPDFIEERHLAWLWNTVNRPYKLYKVLFLIFSYLQLFLTRIFTGKKYIQS